MSVDYRRIDVASVFKGEVLAGELRRDNDDVTFTYADDYLSGTGPPIATTLPLRRAPYVERGGAVPPFFAGLLPEGRRQTAVREKLKTSADDEFTQLIAVGSDCIGDVRVLTLQGEDDPDDVKVPDAPVEFRALFADILATRPLADRSMPGVQDKLSDEMISVPVTGRYGPAIVKLSPAAYPRIVENEAFCLDLARRCGLVVPRHRIISDVAGETALVVERFDRIASRGGVTRIAQEDAVQLLGRWPASKYLLSTREVIRAVAAVSAAPTVEALGVVRLFAFSYLIGNGDLHGKNVSVSFSGGLWRLAPAYDLVSTLPYGDRSMALSLEGRDDNVRLRDFVALAAREGVGERAVRRAVAQICTGCATWIEGAVAIGFDDRTTAHLIRTTRRRLADLAD
ncbi:MAG: HipA domain-containing protein [Rhodoglobus sp.]